MIDASGGTGNAAAGAGSGKLGDSTAGDGDESSLGEAAGDVPALLQASTAWERKLIDRATRRLRALSWSLSLFGSPEPTDTAESPSASTSTSASERQEGGRATISSGI